MKAKKVLVIESNSKMEGLYYLNLQLFLNIDPIMKQTAHFSYKVLEEQSDIELIVTREKVGDEDTANDILAYLDKKGLGKIPVIIIGSVENQDIEKRVQYIKSGVEMKPLLQAVGSVLSITPDVMMKVKVPKYFPIPINYFTSIKSTNVDLYKISFDDQDEELYSHAFKAAQDVSLESIKSLVGAGASELFTLDIDRLKFMNHLTTETISNLSHRELTEGDRVLAGKAALEFLSSKVSEVGITGQTINLAKSSMRNMINNAKDEPKLRNLLKNLLTNKAGYLYQHTQVTTFVALHIVQNMGWANVTSQEEKLAFIALFHDIAIRDDELAKVAVKQDLKQARLDDNQKKLVENHASIAANLVKKFPDCPADAEAVIRQHHGHMQGTEIPETFDFNISPLTALFMVAEDFANQLVDVAEGESPNRPFIIAGIKKKFSSKKYTKIVKTLEKITL